MTDGARVHRDDLFTRLGPAVPKTWTEFALAVPGAIGAVLGVTVLSSIDGATIRPYLAVLLTLVSTEERIKRVAAMASGLTLSQAEGLETGDPAL